MMNMKRKVEALSILALTAICALPGYAATLAINSTVINAPSVLCTATDGSCAQAYAVTSASNASPNNSVQAISSTQQSSFGFTDSFNETVGGVTSASTLSNFGSNAGTSAGTSTPPWNFQDNILFSTGSGNIAAQVSALYSGITDLQVRIISATNPASAPTLFDLTSNADGATMVGGSGVVTIADGWSTFNIAQGAGVFAATTPNAVGPGTYILQIRGEAGAASSYSGTAVFTPVPLPGALPLLLSGLGGLGLLVRRRRLAPA